MHSITGKKYQKGKKIGSGTFGTVYSVKRNDNRTFAFKEFEKDGLGLELGVLREISILKMLSGNKFNVMNLEDIIIEDDDENTVGIIMKRYDLDLHDAIDKNILNKSNKRIISKGILEAVYFLHENGIIHRDIKPENILLDKNTNPILADFTLSKVYTGVNKQGSHTSKIATVTYRAPEVIEKKPYGFPSDAWSVGVVFYELFTNSHLTAQKDKEALDFLSNEIKKFKNNSTGQTVRGLLITNPAKRWSVQEALSKMFKDIPDIPKIWTGIKSCRITKDVREMCEFFEVEKKVTRWAAQTYVNKTKCTTQSAVELACKFYETELCDYDNEEYPEEEIQILMKMNYNLFI